MHQSNEPAAEQAAERSPLVHKPGLLSHPFLLLAAACLVVNALFDGTSGPLVSGEMLCALIGAGVFLGLYSVCRAGLERGKKLQRFFTVMAVAALIIILLILFLQSEHRLGVLLVGGFAALILAGVLLAVNHMLTVNRLIVLLALAGFLLRLVYILYTPVYERQHDVWYFGGERGHAAYIEYFYNELKIPDFDPRTRWQFYHPPLHHMLSALWMRLNTALGMDYERVKEGVQVLTLFYSSACMILFYKLLRAFSLKGAALVIPFALICFHPSLIIMAGSINNDILSITLALAAILATVRWYQKPTAKRIVPVALAVGGSMMAKLSGGLVAPAIAFVFLIKLIQEKGQFKRYVGQFCLFAVICVPLGLWWSVSNLIRFGMPLNYVPMLSLRDEQYIGGYTVMQRLFDWDPGQLASPFTAWGKYSLSNYYEHNVFLNLIKTSTFGEFTLSLTAEGITPVAWVLLAANAVMIALSLAAMVLVLCRRKSIPWQMKTFLGLVYAVVLGSYLKFCFDFPHTCTMNFRYAVPTLFMGALFLGIWLQKPFTAEKWSKAPAKAVQWSASAAAAVFCLASLTLFTVLGNLF